MYETNSSVKVNTVLATASAVALTLAVMGGHPAVPRREYRMPKIEAVLSRDLVQTLETLNRTCSVQTPTEKMDVISTFIGIMVSESRDLDPEVRAVIQDNFWDLV